MELSIKDMSYPNQRSLVRGYDGENQELIKAKRKMALKDTMNIVSAIRIMTDLNYSDEKIAEIMDQMIVDKHVAFEVIYNTEQDTVLELKQLDPETLLPGYSEANGYYWSQYIGGKTRRAFAPGQVLYLTSEKVFNETVNMIAEES